MREVFFVTDLTSCIVTNGSDARWKMYCSKASIEYFLLSCSCPFVSDLIHERRRKWLRIRDCWLRTPPANLISLWHVFKPTETRSGNALIFALHIQRNLYSKRFLEKQFSPLLCNCFYSGAFLEWSLGSIRRPWIRAFEIPEGIISWVDLQIQMKRRPQDSIR